MRVYNMVSPRTYEPVKNQFVIENGAVTVFQSYASTIAEIDRHNRTITIHPDWNYSRTTGKYRNEFFNDEGFGGLATTEGLRKAMKKGEYNDFKIVTCQTIKSSQMLGLGTEDLAPILLWCLKLFK